MDSFFWLFDYFISTTRSFGFNQQQMWAFVFAMHNKPRTFRYHSLSVCYHQSSARIFDAPVQLCLVRTFSRCFCFCLLRAAWLCMMTLRFLFRGIFRFFAVRLWMALPFSTQKFLVCLSPLLISLHCIWSVVFIAWCSGVFLCFVFFSSACYSLIPRYGLPRFLGGCGMGLGYEDAKIVIHDCLLYRHRDVVLKWYETWCTRTDWNFLFLVACRIAETWSILTIVVCTM